MRAAMPVIAPALASVADGLGQCPMSFPSSAGYNLTSGVVYYTCLELLHPGPFSLATMRLTAATTGGTPTLGVAIYEISMATGLPGKKLIDFGSLGSTSGTAPFNLTSTALSTPDDLVPGWYCFAYLSVANGATGTVTVGACTPLPSPFGTYLSGDTDFHVNTVLQVTGQTTLTDPATAPVQADNASAGCMIAFFK